MKHNDISNEPLVPQLQDRELARRVMLAQLRLFSQHTISTLYSSLAVTLALIWFFWGELSPNLLIIWGTAQVLILVVRFYGLKRFTGLNDATVDCDLWLFRHGAGTAVSGVAWGAGFALMYGVTNLDHRILVAVTLPALCGASLGTLSILPRIYPFYAVCIMTPFVVINMLQGKALGYTLAILGTVYVLTLFSVSRRFTAMVSDTLRLGIQNRLLLEQADASNRAKSAFLSSVSHELRTPLTSIRGFASLIGREFARGFVPLVVNDEKLNKKAGRIRDNVEIILKESERLTRLINEVLDLAKIEAGRIEWNDVPLAPARLVADAIASVRGVFEMKPSVMLLVDVAEGLPVISGDADRLQQVLVNLLDNAAKFTDHGEVKVRVCSGSTDDILFEVSDTGCGFPPEEAESIFDKFQQSSRGDTLTDKPEGTGLGLTIAREVIERHGGRIWANSTPGEGSVFSFVLPKRSES